ncbi:MAG TPA: sugar MFS transporter [Nevskiaceae bacterium]|nr:sugar MFS transporter [Nevskiaceae bacterium]
MNDNTHGLDLRTPLRYTIVTFFIWGLAYGLLDVLNKHFQEILHVGKAQSAWLQIAYFGAYLTMSIPAGMWMHARGYKVGILTGLTVAAGGAFLFIPAASAMSFPFFVGAMFVLATGLCFLETSADTYVNVLGAPEHAERRLNLAQSFTGLGGFLGPMIGGAVFFGGTAAAGEELHSVQLTYGVIGALILLYAVFIARAQLPEIQAATITDTGASRPLSTRSHFIFGVITQALYVGAQVGIGAYFINLVTESWKGLSSQEGAFLLSVATLLYLVGRFLSTALMTRFDPRKILTTYGLANVALTLIVAAGIDKVSAIALVGVFFFMSAMFATTFTLGIKDLGAQTKRGSSFMVMAIGGGVLLPYPMGMIAESYGSPAAFLLPCACFALVAWYGWRGAEVR